MTKNLVHTRKPGALKNAPQRVRTLSGRRAAASPAVALPAQMLHIHVIALDALGSVEVRAPDGAVQTARCALGIDLEWLHAALELAPVPGVVVTPIGSAAPVLLCLVPDDVHRDLPVDRFLRGRRVEITASEQLTIHSGRSSVKLTEDGEVRIQGRQLLSRATGINSIKGGVIRLN